MTRQDQTIEDHRDDPDHDVEAIANAARCPTSQDEKSARRRLIAERRLIVRGIHVPFAAQEELEDALDEAMDAVPGLREAGLPAPTLSALADSFSGKTSRAKRYIRNYYANNEIEPGTVPIAYVKLDTDGTLGSLATDILIGTGEKRPASLTPANRWNRARQSIKDRKVSLMVFDEFQRAGRRPTLSPVIAGRILDIVDDGDCACAFVGKKDADRIFAACPDLENRLDAPVHMPRLRWSTDADEFMKFARDFDKALVAAGVTRIMSGLGRKQTAQLLLEASNGLIGQFSRIVETAVIMITREGNDVITQRDLSDAVEEWSIGNGRIGYNPFATGVKNDQPLEAEMTEEHDDDDQMDAKA